MLRCPSADAISEDSLLAGSEFSATAAFFYLTADLKNESCEHLLS